MNLLTMFSLVNAMFPEDLDLFDLASLPWMQPSASKSSWKGHMMGSYYPRLESLGNARLSQAWQKRGLWRNKKARACGAYLAICTPQTSLSLINERQRGEL